MEVAVRDDGEARLNYVHSQSFQLHGHLYFPVSYTHLDVYKRQQVDVAGGDTLKVGFQRTGDRFTSVTLTGPADLVFTGDIEPVSYTHLDVYKRQILAFRPPVVFTSPRSPCKPKSRVRLAVDRCV